MWNDILNGIMEIVNGFESDIINALPGSPFSYYQTLDNEILRAINWLIPVGEMIAIMEGWLVCIALWYAARVFMRWLKAAGGG